MDFKSLSGRLDSLPLILAGPIVRRTEPKQVTVWVALKELRKVTLRIYEGSGEVPKKKEGMTPEELENVDKDIKEILRFSGTATTIRLGNSLHLTAVTARTTDESKALEWGKHYYYDLFFDEPGDDDTPVVDMVEKSLRAEKQHKILSTEQILVEITYGNSPLPSFVLPAKELKDLRIIHSSCRKPHGEGEDMLAKVDELIEKSPAPEQRPQQLFLTGDQIYADDVAPSMLAMLMDASDALLEWKEKLPGIKTNDARLEPRFGFKLTDQSLNEMKADGYYPEIVELLSGVEHEEMEKLSNLKALLRDVINRSDPPINQGDVVGFLNTLEKYTLPPRIRLSEKIAKFTAGGVAANHLFTAGEYWMMYIFVWSSVLWDESAWGDNLTSENEIDKRVNKLYEKLPNVRKALANISTYMICDDHEITDDWLLNLQWCVDVFSSQLGQRILLNGMLGYALFQAWGNDPDQFEAGNPDGIGYQFLETVQKWRPTGDIVQFEITTESRFKMFNDNVPDYVINKLKDLDEPINGEASFLDRIKQTLPGVFEVYETAILQHVEESRDNPDIEMILKLAVGIADADMVKKIKEARSLHVIHENAEALNWHYHVPGSKHQVIVLDTRTWRYFPGAPVKDDTDELEDGYNAPALLGKEALIAQILPYKTTDSPFEITFIVSAAPVVSVGHLSGLRSGIAGTGRTWILAKGERGEHFADYEDWEYQKEAVWLFYATLSAIGRVSELSGEELYLSRIVFLSGDVHYGYASRIDYERLPLSSPLECPGFPDLSDLPMLFGLERGAKAIFAQLNSSALKNQDVKTRLAQQFGYLSRENDTEKDENTKAACESIEHIVAHKDIEPMNCNFPFSIIPILIISQVACIANWKRKQIYNTKEIVGLNNISLISFDSREEMLIHNLFWKNDEEKELENRYNIKLGFKSA